LTHSPAIYEPQIKINSSNLRKHYLISTELSPLTNKDIEHDEIENAYEVLHNKYEICEKEIEQFLQNEKNTLDRLVSIIEKARGENLIDDEIAKVENDLFRQSSENLKMLERYLEILLFYFKKNNHPVFFYL
jgi:hypothetical protein